MEISTGILFVFLYLFYGLSLELVLTIFYCSLFIALMVIDFEQYIIPNRIIYPAAAVSLLVALLRPDWRVSQSIIGGGIGLGIFLVIVILSRGGMGWGDVKLAALVGLITGFPLVFVAVFLSIVGGGLLALLLLFTGIKKRKEAIPFGPFLSLAAMVTLLWGSQVLNWYLGLLHRV
jgi:leader peptidase (prepilin peptidase)/N-methyltransferase